MSLRRRLINGFLRAVEKRHLARIEDPLELRRSFEFKARLFFHGPHGSRYEACDLGGVSGVRAAAPGAEQHRAILYFHGGGYVFGSPRTHQAMLARLSALSGRVAWLPDYRMAPENPFPAAVEDAILTYRALCDRVGAENIVIGGDSAGGGLALALLAEICAGQMAQPAATFAFSPLTDMSFSGASIKENEQAEVMLPVSRIREIQQMYLQGADARDRRASPLFGDFTGAGPVWISVGDSEILRDDTLRMAVHLKGQGVTVTQVLGHDLPHVWPMFQRIMPEADATLRDLGRWISSLSGLKGES